MKPGSTFTDFLTSCCLLFLTTTAYSSDTLMDQFVADENWQLVGDVEAIEEEIITLSPGTNILINSEGADALETREIYRDIAVRMEFMLSTEANTGLLFMGRYELQLVDWDPEDDALSYYDMGALYQRWDDAVETNRGFEGAPPKIYAGKPDGEWQTVEAVFRAPRFSDDGTKLSHARFIDVHINGQLVQKDLVAKGPSRSAQYDGEAATAPLLLERPGGDIAIRTFSVDILNLDDYPTPALSAAESAPLDSDGHAMIDQVAAGTAAFLNHGCFECHTTTTDDRQNKSGPSLFGLLQTTPVGHMVLSAEKTRLIEVKADRDYIESSVRQPADQLALRKGDEAEPYLPVMPAFPSEILSDNDMTAIAAYLETLNAKENRGPLKKWVTKPDPPYVLAEDQYAVWVKDRIRLQRVDVGEKHSGRAYHVGLPGDINYNFDPRILAVVDIWSGSFLTVRNEQRGRGGLPSEYGYNATVWPTKHNLFQPLYEDGSPVDFSFKEPAHVDEALGGTLIADRSDYVATVESYTARFEGVNTPMDGLPGFNYSVDGNEIVLRFEPFPDGRIEAHFKMTLISEQSFRIPNSLLSNIKVSDGTVTDGKWTMPAGQYEAVMFRAKVVDSPAHDFKDEGIPVETLDGQPLQWRESQAEADLPAGYSLADAVSPLDRFGREHLFEPMGIDFLNEDVAFISTRTAGIWKIVNGEWFLFAEGVYESLGLIAETENRVLIGEKPGLTLLIDNDGDHWAERRENISDQFRFAGNYHSYLHGPVKRGASYFYNLNLAHNLPGYYKAGGAFMGTIGGMRGWLIEVNDDGEFIPFANGFRSPAGLAVSPSNDIIYTENQGEYVSTSKIFKIEKGKFYGNPAGLIDLPGMNHLSPQVQWDAVKDTRKRPILLLPHDRAMNSPGSPVWDTTGGEFGPFTGQMLVGDQTQSNIFRVFTEQVNGIEQGVLLPFADSLSSGVMRLAFDPADHSLWIGQTGRGWAAKGGSLSALQRISWDGTEPDAIHRVKVTATGFEIIFTKPQQAADFGNIDLSSWYYQDSPGYGSAELGKRQELISAYRWSVDSKHVFIDLQDFELSTKDETDTSRVYRIDLSQTTFGKIHGKFHSQAYYTLHAIPGDDSLDDVETVVVTGSRVTDHLANIPNTTSVISLQELEAQNALSVSDALRRLPGVHVVQPSGQGGVARLFVRGGDSEFTMVLLDGVRVNDPNDSRGTAYDFSEINLNDIERIEIVRGPQSAVYGSGALAGVINLISKAPAKEFGASVFVEAGSDDYYRGALDVSGPVGNSGAFSLRAMSKDDGEPVEDTTFESNSLSGRLSFGDADEWNLSFFGNYTDSNGTSFPEDSGGADLAVIRMTDTRSAESLRLGIKGQASLGQNWDLNFLTSWFDKDSAYLSPGVAAGVRDAVPPNGAEANFNRVDVALHAVVDINDAFTTTFGLDYYVEDGVSDGFVEFFPGYVLPAGYTFNRNVTGAFGELHYVAENGLTLMASVRRDDSNNEPAETTSRVGSLYRSNDGDTQVRANWGQGFSLPGFFALASPLVGNPDLRPETSESYDIGVSHHFVDGLSGTLTLFHNEFTDLIDFDSDTFQMVNRDRLDTDGVEMQLEFAVSESLSVNAQATYLDMELLNDDSLLRQRPDWRGGLSLHWVPDSSWEIDASWLYSGESFDSSIPTGDQFLDSYNRLDATAIYHQSEALQLILSLTNLFDANYYEAIGFPAPGTRLRVGLRYQF
jgi:outer membrane cobalamin receptor/mono/diheme cytochrome c family protein